MHHQPSDPLLPHPPTSSPPSSPPSTHTHTHTFTIKPQFVTWEIRKTGGRGPSGGPTPPAAAEAKSAKAKAKAPAAPPPLPGAPAVLALAQLIEAYVAERAAHLEVLIEYLWRSQNLYQNEVANFTKPEFQKGWPKTGQWKHGPKPAVCPSCLSLSHTH